MNALKLTSLAVFIALASTCSVLAKDTPNAPEKKEKTWLPSWAKYNHKPYVDVRSTPHQPAGDVPEPQSPLGISDDERRIIREFIRTSSTVTPRGQTSHKIPPAWSKKIQGDNLPPDWEKKVAKGEKLPQAILTQCEPLPRELTVKFPPAPKGTVLVTMEGKILRLVHATHEITDVFDVTQ